MENPAGPAISMTMIESRIKDRVEFAESQIETVLKDIGTEVNRVVADLVNDAYAKGLADGFAQRVFADGQNTVGE